MAKDSKNYACASDTAYATPDFKTTNTYMLFKHVDGSGKSVKVYNITETCSSYWVLQEVKTGVGAGNYYNCEAGCTNPLTEIPNVQGVCVSFTLGTYATSGPIIPTAAKFWE